MASFRLRHNYEWETLKRILLTRKIELFLSSDCVEGPRVWLRILLPASEALWASPEPELWLWPPPRLQLALLRRNNQAQAPPGGKYSSTISEIIWRARAEPKICEAICYECSSLVNTYRVTGGIWTFSLYNAIIVIHGLWLPGLMEQWRTGSRTFSPQLKQKWGRPCFLSRCVQTCSLQNANLTSFR